MEAQGATVEEEFTMILYAAMSLGAGNGELRGIRRALRVMCGATPGVTQGS